MRREAGTRVRHFISQDRPKGRCQTRNDVDRPYARPLAVTGTNSFTAWSSTDSDPTATPK
jgi:hypothetical protein